MDSPSKEISSVEDYIASFPQELQARLEQLRQTIRNAAPDAKETISYHMPTYLLQGKLVYFAAWKNHIALYAAGSAASAYAAELAPYIAEKGTIKFPNDAPLPLDLIRRIVEYRVQENLAKQTS